MAPSRAPGGGVATLRPERYLVLDGEKREAKERDSLLSSYMRGGAASARRRDGRGAWRALCGRGNHLSYTENLVVNLPVRGMSATSSSRRRSRSAEDGLRLTRLLGRTARRGRGRGDAPSELRRRALRRARDDRRGRAKAETKGRRREGGTRGRRPTAPMSAHLLFQMLRREDRDEDVAASRSAVGASRSAVGASRSAGSLDPLTGVARLVTFQRLTSTTTAARLILDCPGASRAPRCTRKTDASCSATATRVRVRVRVRVWG